MKILLTILGTLVFDFITYVVLIIIPIYLLDSIGVIDLYEIIGINPPHTKLTSIGLALSWLGLLAAKILDIYERQ